MSNHQKHVEALSKAAESTQGASPGYVLRRLEPCNGSGATHLEFIHSCEACRNRAAAAKLIQERVS